MHIQHTPHPQTLCELTVECLPPTINHYYGRRGFSSYLKPEAKIFRAKVQGAWTAARRVYPDAIAPQPLGLIVKLFSPRWYSKAGEVRRIDLDNRLKAAFDALQNASGIPDEFIFELRCGKYLSSSEYTLFCLYALDGKLKEGAL